MLRIIAYFTMLRKLPLGSSAYNNTETNNKLLELTDRDTNDDAATNAEDTEQEDVDAQVPDPASIASVVTQVNTVDSRAGTSSHNEDIDGRSSWKSKFRYVLLYSLILIYPCLLCFHSLFSHLLHLF